MNDRAPDLEADLARLRPVAPRPELRDEVFAGVRSRLSPFHLGRARPWAVAASLLVALGLAARMSESAYERNRAEIRAGSPTPVTEDHRRWAAHVRLVQKKGLPNG